MYVFYFRTYSVKNFKLFWMIKKNTSSLLELISSLYFIKFIRKYDKTHLLEGGSNFMRKLQLSAPDRRIGNVLLSRERREKEVWPRVKPSDTPFTESSINSVESYCRLHLLLTPAFLLLDFYQHRRIELF